MTGRTPSPLDQHSVRQRAPDRNHAMAAAEVEEFESQARVYAQLHFRFSDTTYASFIVALKSSVYIFAPCKHLNANVGHSRKNPASTRAPSRRCRSHAARQSQFP